jgi:hypothetical protein
MSFAVVTKDTTRHSDSNSFVGQLAQYHSVTESKMLEFEEHIIKKIAQNAAQVTYRKI